MTTYPFYTRRRASFWQGPIVQRLPWVLCALGLLVMGLRDWGGPTLEPYLSNGLATVLAWLLILLGAVGIAMIQLRPLRQTTATQASVPPPARSAHKASTTKSGNVERITPRPMPVPLNGLTHFPETMMLPREVAQSKFGPGVESSPTAFSLELLQSMDWRRFEALCTQLFAQAGFEARPQAMGSYNGVNIWLFSRHQPGEAISMVRCCHWVSPEQLPEHFRQLADTAKQHQQARVTYVTAAPVDTASAQAAQADNIRVIDAGELLRLIEQRTPAQQSALLAVATEGEYWRPTCANCGLKMLGSEESGHQADHWSCPQAPSCRETLPIRGA